MNNSPYSYSSYLLLNGIVIAESSLQITSSFTINNQSSTPTCKIDHYSSIRNSLLQANNLDEISLSYDGVQDGITQQSKEAVYSAKYSFNLHHCCDSNNNNNNNNNSSNNTAPPYVLGYTYPEDLLLSANSPGFSFKHLGQVNTDTNNNNNNHEIIFSNGIGIPYFENLKSSHIPIQVGQDKLGHHIYCTQIIEGKNTFNIYMPTFHTHPHDLILDE